MKYCKLFIYCLVTVCLGVYNISSAQEISIGDAIEQPDHQWSIETVRYDTEEPIALPPFNSWHVTTEGTFDQVDAATVTAPFDESVWANLSLEIEGPFIITFQTRIKLAPYYNSFWFNLRNSEEERILHANVGTSEEWKESTFVIRETGPMKLIWQAQFLDDPLGQVWLDQIEITKKFPPTIETSIQEFLPILVGKQPSLGSEFFHVAGVGELHYQWYKDDVPLEGENQTVLQLPIQNQSTGSFYYELEVSDDLGSARTNPIEVFYFSINEALDNEDLVFSVPDIPGQDYARMHLGPDAAPDGIDAIRLSRSRSFDPGELAELSTQVEGPAILHYVGNARILIDGMIPLKKEHPIGNELFHTVITLPQSRIHDVKWFAPNATIHGGLATLDQVISTSNPVFLKEPQDSASVVGVNKFLDYEAIGLSATTHQLLKNDKVIMESGNQSINLDSLTLDQSGTYQIRIKDELGGETLSEPFEITIVDTIGEAVEQPDLVWTYEGEELWIPQIYDTYDGDDAAAHLDTGDGSGSVSTQIPGPAQLSFWWKDATTYEVNGTTRSVLQETYDSWQRVVTILPLENNTVTWHKGFLDRLDITPIQPIGEAVEQPDLTWHFGGPDIWQPQTEESYDGEDAAALIHDRGGVGLLYTTVPGPAIVSFWWKDGDTFSTDTETITYEGEGWQQVQTVVLTEAGNLSWNAGYLDQLHIEDLSEDPFKQWAFTKFDSDEVLNDFESVLEGDRDFDAISNFLEWALNRNVDFPNQPIRYRIVEEDGKRYLGIEYSHPAELGEFAVNLEASSDLTTWQQIDSVVSQTYNPSNNTYTVLARDIQPLDTESARFIQLMVTDE